MLVVVDTETVQLFVALLSLIAAAGTLGIVALAIAGRTNPAARGMLGQLAGAAPWLAFLVAISATVGSLYFSEVADYEPCRLCWFQRIGMYPLAAILLVAAIRRDRAARWYVLPIAAGGLAVSVWHYLIEWWPSLDGGACGATGPLCSVIWFREFGFITLAFMAGVGFLSILALMFLVPPARLDGDPTPPEES